MVQFHQEIKLAESILIDENTDKDILESDVKRNDTEMMRYKNMVTLDPGPEKAVYLQHAYPKSGEVKGANSKEEGFQSGCEDENSGNNETGKLGHKSKYDEIEQLHLTHSDFSGQIDKSKQV